MLLYFSVFTCWINNDCCNAQRFEFSSKPIAATVVNCLLFGPAVFVVNNNVLHIIFAFAGSISKRDIESSINLITMCLL